MKNSILLYWFVGLVLVSCSKMSSPDANLNHITTSNQVLTNTIVEDIFTPPVAARIYAYSNIAAYEVLSFTPDSLQSLNNRLNELSYSLERPGNIDYSVASLVAFTEVAKELVFNPDHLDAYQANTIDSLSKVYNYSFESEVDFGKKVSSIVISWSTKDGYHERTGLKRHEIKYEPGKWIPTPPDYMDGIEPHWSTLRPFVLDSASQFPPNPPTSFDSVKNSGFYKDSYYVYQTVNQITPEQVDIAKFWDCNPNISYHRGHMMFFEQKLSPGGHWIGIAQQVCEGKDLDIFQSTKTMAMVSIGLADAFISCWDEKYRSNLVRPETYINRYISEEWKPVLQTPAFPEYTSGHSVISSSAAAVLTSIHGDSYSFTDSTEVPFGLPARSYESFYDASNEAAISRLYGGIHYLPAIENGVEQGKEVGNYVVQSLLNE